MRVATFLLLTGDVRGQQHLTEVQTSDGTTHPPVDGGDKLQIGKSGRERPLAFAYSIRIVLSLSCGCVIVTDTARL